MSMFRKFVVFVFSVLLFFILIAAAGATTFNLLFAQPTKIENLLVESKLYDHFVQNALQQVEKSSSGSSNGGGISINDPAVQQAASEAFSPAILQQYVKTFLDANYAWLQGKTDKPIFVIDLTATKNNFAKLVGQAVTEHLASLPVCTNALVVNYDSSDPLALTCRPAGINPAVEGAKVTLKLASSDGFMSKTIITADTISSNNSKLYYQKASFAPSVYKYATYSPYALAGVAVILSVSIFFIAPRRRNGLRSISIVFLLSGLVLVGTKIAINLGYKKYSGKLFNDGSIGPLQQSLTDFANRLQALAANYYMYIGIGLLVLSIIGFVIVIATKKRGNKSRGKSPAPKAVTNTPTTPQSPVSAAPTAAQTPSTSTQPTRTAPTVPASSTPPRPKRPRLIQ